MASASFPSFRFHYISLRRECQTKGGKGPQAVGTRISHATNRCVSLTFIATRGYTLDRGKTRQMEFNKLPEKEKLCIICSKCCREIGIYTHPGLYTCSAEELVEFYEARGFAVTKSGDALILSLKISCPHLTQVGCDIYERRPQVCKEYSGLDDFGDGCLWSVLPEQRKRGRQNA